MPVIERVIELSILGHNQDDIWATICSEFEDILFNPISKLVVKNIISDNMEVIKKRRERMGELYQQDTEKEMLELVRVARPAEVLLVHTYANKISEAAQEMNSLDLSAKDDDGNFVNTGRIMNLIAMTDKMHGILAKITCLDAIRDFELFKQKTTFAAQAKLGSGGLIPDSNGMAQTKPTEPSKTIDMPEMD